MAFTLPSPADTVIGFVMNRLRPDFTERDRSVLNGVRPFVQHAYERVTAGPRLRPARELGLTDRQGEILRLVAGGPTDYAQIALRLGLTERTRVGKRLRECVRAARRYEPHRGGRPRHGPGLSPDRRCVANHPFRVRTVAGLVADDRPG